MPTWCKFLASLANILCFRRCKNFVSLIHLYLSFISVLRLNVKCFFSIPFLFYSTRKISRFFCSVLGECISLHAGLRAPLRCALRAWAAPAAPIACSLISRVGASRTSAGLPDRHEGPGASVARAANAVRAARTAPTSSAARLDLGL